MLFHLTKKLTPELRYGLPLPTHAWLFKFFLLNLCPRTECCLTQGQSEKTKQPKKKHYLL